MRNEFTAIIEKDDDWYIAYCPEISGANGQGRTEEDARLDIAEAIALILEDRRIDVQANWSHCESNPVHSRIKSGQALSLSKGGSADHGSTSLS